MRIGSRSRIALAAGMAALAAAACAGDPVQEVERRRAAYEAELTGFLVRDDPAAERPTIVLDVLVRGEAKPPLAGLTLDISMADAAGREKARRRAWVDTRGIGPGGVQTAVTLEGLEYATGDGFWVEVRSPIPAAERGEYREFGGGGG
jgi:hypothetical protein